MDQGEEMDRLYFDQMLLELLLRPQMTNVTDVCSSDGTPELAKIRPATILDDQSKALVSTKRRERNANGSTVVDISMTPPSFKLVPLS